MATRFSLSAALLGVALTWNESPGVAADTLGADPGAAQPQDGVITDHVYRNPYFDLAYPLPAGWKAGLDGPPPSNSGSYVLSTPVPEGEPKATMLIAAQDMFFAAKPMENAAVMAEALRRNAAAISGLSAQSQQAQVKIAGRRFTRVDLGGTDLSRIFLATEIRCHIVSFTFAASDPRLLETLAASVAEASLPQEDASSIDADERAPPSSVPVCIKDYATPETVLRKVAPAAVGPAYFKIPVRIIIGRDGKVEHVHVIRAFPAQAKSIEDALATWQFKPYVVNGVPAEVETGLLFEFKPTDQSR